jgi:hypothetical protein
VSRIPIVCESNDNIINKSLTKTVPNTSLKPTTATPQSRRFTKRKEMRSFLFKMSQELLREGVLFCAANLQEELTSRLGKVETGEKLVALKFLFKSSLSFTFYNTG